MSNRNDANDFFGCLGCLISPFVFLAIFFLGCWLVKLTYRLAFGE
jgi:hypothetical protein